MESDIAIVSDGTKQGVTLRLGLVWSCSKAEKSDAGMEAPKQRGDRKEMRREGRLEKDKKQRGEKGRKKKNARSYNQAANRGRGGKKTVTSRGDGGKLCDG